MPLTRSQNNKRQPPPPPQQQQQPKRGRPPKKKKKKQEAEWLRLEQAWKASFQLGSNQNITLKEGRVSGLSVFSLVPPPPTTTTMTTTENNEMPMTQHKHNNVWQRLVEIHDQICKSVPQGVTWGDDDDDNLHDGSSQVVDPRRRRYAFLPGQRARLIASGIRIQTSSIKEQEHETTLTQSSMDIIWKEEQGDDGDDDDDDKKTDNNNNNNKSREETLLSWQFPKDPYYKALEAVTMRIQQSIHDPYYKKFVTIDQLVALQPNHHYGSRYLPLHLDFPRHDGFGIVICTIGIRHCQDSHVVLLDDGDSANNNNNNNNNETQQCSWSFHMTNGDVYVLSGNARNKCLHGVMIMPDNDTNDDTNSDDGGVYQRETLNLRYGLHTPEMAHEEVDRHWLD